MMINPPRESMGREDKEQLVMRLLTRQLQWIFAKSPHYQKILSDLVEQKNDVAKLLEPERWTKIPLTETLPDDLWSLLTGPISNTMRFTKNLEGKYFALSQGDLTGNLDMVTRALAANNINKTSMVIICGDYTKQGILDLHYGTEALGATVFPCGTLDDLAQIYEDFHPETIIGDKNVENFCQNNKIKPVRFILLDTAIPEAEEEGRGFIYWDKITGYTAWAFTCEAGHYHLQDDYLKVELVENRVVFTPLTLENMPLLKVATPLLGKNLNRELCSCGRTLCTLK